VDHLAARLIEWFERTGRRLPWRAPFPRDPFRVLVSEVMLQQTQVSRVVEPYLLFLARFPTIASVAASAEDDVVRAFSGLGYYGRARRLHATARAIVEHGGWPQGRAELARLPGIGAYTSAAVAAFCFAGADPPVDGNIARLAGGSSALSRGAERFARRLHEEQRTPLVWEALMELGARVCTPTRPKCPTCPLAAGCAGRREGPEAYPRPRAQRPTEDTVWVAVWLERCDGRVLLRRVDKGEPLRGLWLPPFAVLGRGADPGAAARALATSACCAVPLRAAGRIGHGITHRRITVLPFVGTVLDGRVAEPSDGERWENPLDPLVPTPGLLSKLRVACTGAPAASPAPKLAEG
jgi:A/G-specific adenine glycosylase